MDRSRTALLVSLFALVLVAPLAAREGPQGGARSDVAYRILVTNDDGVAARGLEALVAELCKEAEVVVSAPEENRSGASHSTMIFQGPLVVTDHKVAGATSAVGVSGSPADAALFGILELGGEKPFDLVVSGINEGANVGMVAHYSGTVGAAMEGALHGLPAIAVSADAKVHDYGLAARFTASFVHRLLAEKVHPGLVYNVNVPGEKPGEIKGVKVARMGAAYFGLDGFKGERDASGKSRYAAVPKMRRTDDEGTDTRAYFEGFITVTPLRFDWSDQDAIGTMQAWKLTVE